MTATVTKWDPPVRLPPRPIAALCYEFPLRLPFMAQIVVPRDLTSEEAERLCAFIRALTVPWKS